MKALELNYTLKHLTGIDIKLIEGELGVCMVYTGTNTPPRVARKLYTDIMKVTDVSIEFWLGETIHFIEYKVRQNIGENTQRDSPVD